MRNNHLSAAAMLQHAKDTLAESHDRNALIVALLDISAALDEWVGKRAPHVRARPQRYDVANYREMPEYKAKQAQGPALRLEDKLRQHRREGLITAAEADHIVAMREARNVVAHGGKPNLTYAGISWYGELVEILTGRRRLGSSPSNTVAFQAKRSSGRPMRRAAGSTPPLKQAVAAPLPPAQHLPVQPPQPAAAQALSNNDFLAQLLEIHLGDDRQP